MQRRGLIVVVVTALPALAACLLTTDLDSLSEPDPTIIINNSSGSTSGTSGAVEGGVDGGADVANDVVVPVTDGAAFCTGHPDATFCTEFSTPIAQEWATTEKTARGDVTTTMEAPRSPPVALRATIAPGPAAPDRAYVTRAFSPKIYSYVRWSFDIRIGGLGTGQAEVGSLTFDPDGAGNAYIPVIRRDRSLLLLAQRDQTGSEEYFGPFATLNANVWVRIMVEVELSSAAPSRVSLYLDGTKVLSQQVVNQGLGPNTFILAQGVHFQRREMQDVETKLDFDNVLIEAR